MVPPDEKAPISEVTSRRLLRNTIANGLANGSNAVVTAILTPFLLHRLGAEQYGVWLLALGLTFSSGYLALADLGLADAAVKFIAEARALGVVHRINEIASTTFAAFSIIGALAACVTVLAAPLLVGIFNVSPGLAGVARTVFVLMALEVAVELPVSALRAVIEGAQRYAWLRTIDVGGRLLWGGFAIVAVSAGHGIVALAVASLVIAAARGVMSLLVAHRIQPELRLRASSITRDALRRTVSYGSYVGGLRFLSVIYAQMDRLIIGIALTVAAVASYEVAFRIQSLATLVMVMASSAVLPAAAYNAIRSDNDKQREMYLRGTKYGIALVLPITIAALLYTRPLLVTWVGAQYTSVTTPARLFLVFPLFGCINQVGVAMLIGLGKAKRVLKLQIVSVGLNLIMSIVLVSWLGLSGVVLGTLIGGLIVWLPYLHLLLATFEVEPREWLRRVVVPNMPGTGAQLGLGLVTIRWASQLDRLWQVVVLCGASCLIHVVAFAVVGLQTSELRHLTDRLTGAG